VIVAPVQRATGSPRTASSGAKARCRPRSRPSPLPVRDATPDSNSSGSRVVPSIAHPRSIHALMRSIRRLIATTARAKTVMIPVRDVVAGLEVEDELAAIPGQLNVSSVRTAPERSSAACNPVTVHDRNEGVAEGVPDDYGPLLQPAGSGGSM